MSEDRLSKLEGSMTDMAVSVKELVVELKHSNANFAKQQQQHSDDMAELKIVIAEMGFKIESNKEKHGERLRGLENKMPLIEEWRANSNKVRTAVTAGLILASIIGGIIGRYT